MRIIQIIDSLEAGGAERMAVNYANALVKQIDFSGLVVTRKEGNLKGQLDNQVSYLFLNKRRTLDFTAVIRLRNYVKKHKVTVVHAHGTSFFMAFLLKMNCPSLKLIWHDHYGDSEFLSQRASLSLKIILPFFDGIIAVNQKLKVWVEQKLNFKNTVYLPNFLCEEKNVTDNTVLKGTTGKRIVCLANLRVQKDHFLLLEVAKKIKQSHPDWTVHLVGKDFDDDYSKKIKNIIVEFNLEKTVFFYGAKQDVSNILNQSTIGVLTSKSEGLPVALLEYGRHKMPVVVTNVGEISSLVQDSKNGFVVVAQNEELFHKALILLMENDFISMNFGDALYKTVLQNNSEEVVIKQYLSWLQNNKQK